MAGANADDAVQRTVLVVEDDPDGREVLSALLERQGFTVREAADGREALDLLTYELTEPCTIVLDLMMPIMTGWQLLEELEKSGRHRHSTIVIVSAACEASLPRDYPVVRKPIHFDDLLDVVGSAA
jgi:CheY-like chemotaxis protein